MKRRALVLFTLMLLFVGCADKEKTSYEIVSECYGNGYDGWQEAYEVYLDEISEGEMKFAYSLIYLDEDETPELFITTDSSAGGERILTYENGELHLLCLSRLGSKYIPEKGLVYNNCGHMDYYPVYIYKLYDGDFYVMGEGIWGGLEWEDGVELNESGEPDYQYEWEGKSCTEEKFYEEIDKVFPLEKGVRPVKWEEWYEE